MPGKARREPESQAQRRAMYAAAEGHSYLGIPAKVGKEFVKAGHGVTGLPERKAQRQAKATRERIGGHKGGP